MNSYFYSSVSLIELKWLFIKLEKGKSHKDIEIIQDRFKRSINVLLNDNRFTKLEFTNIEIYRISDEIRNFGLRDYFDSIIAATSLWRCEVLLTQDKWLLNNVGKINKVAKINLKFRVLSWKQYRNQL
ncbi:MAG: hypothetical protein IH840_16605 [Candidatus Heimdallarchaeota archaeon]|nr:hypothetical protein [Candidatus Heimdallarchaeota archaeon]